MDPFGRVLICFLQSTCSQESSSEEESGSGIVNAVKFRACGTRFNEDSSDEVKREDEGTFKLIMHRVFEDD